MKLGQLEVNLSELTEFIVKAKKNGYAAGGEKRREPDGSKTFTFLEGNFHYTDNYAGSYRAPGNEIVRWKREDGQRIWHLAYSGGIEPEFWGNEEIKESTLAFLKEALMLVSFDHPFRGPQKYENKDLKYIMEVAGNIRRFFGTEETTDKRLNRITFSQDFMGGLVIPKIITRQ